MSYIDDHCILTYSNTHPPFMRTLDICLQLYNWGRESIHIYEIIRLGDSTSAPAYDANWETANPKT